MQCGGGESASEFVHFKHELICQSHAHARQIFPLTHECGVGAALRGALPYGTASTCKCVCVCGGGHEQGAWVVLVCCMGSCVVNFAFILTDWVQVGMAATRV